MSTKRPIIRPRQATPYKKATRQQIAERVQYVARLIARDNTNGGIHRAMKEKFGIGWRQCERYMARVRTHARENYSRSEPSYEGNCPNRGG